MNGFSGSPTGWNQISLPCRSTIIRPCWIASLAITLVTVSTTYAGVVSVVEKCVTLTVGGLRSGRVRNVWTAAAVSPPDCAAACAVCFLVVSAAAPAAVSDGCSS